VLCLLCVTLLVCSSYSSFAPSSPFFSSWWQKDCGLFTHTLALQCSPTTLWRSRQPQTTHVFADSRPGIALLCLAPPGSCPFSLLVHWAFGACQVIEIAFHYCTTPPCHKISLFLQLAWKNGQNRFLDEVTLDKCECNPWRNWMRPAPTQMIE